MTEVNNDILERVIRGDREALAACLEEIGPQVRSEIAPQIPARWRSVLSEDDVMQQTYADALRDISRFVPLGKGAFHAWLASVAECNLRDALKMLEANKRGGDRRRIGSVGTDESYQGLLDLLSSSGTSPTGQVHRGEVRETILGALAALPASYQTVVRMYDLEGRGVDEVGEALGRSAGAVYMLRARAHDRMRSALGQEANYFSDSP